MYHILNVNAGIQIPEADFLKRMRRWLTASFVVEIFYYTTLISFKLSMLFFFKRLGNSMDKFNYLWWPILLFSLSTYFVSIRNVEYKCLFGSLETITVYCNSPDATSFLKNTLAANCALDVLSDFSIMLIPIILLWNVQIRWQKKIVFMGIFSLSIVIIGVSIARAADIDATQKSNGLPDGTYLWFWSSCQSFLCIVVACSTSFRQLFAASTRSQNKPIWTPTASYYERMASRFRSRPKRQNDITLYDVSAVTQASENFDYVTMREGSQVALNDSSQACVLVPGEPNPSLAACYKVDNPRHVTGNKIRQEREYRVTQQPR